MTSQRRRRRPTLRACGLLIALQAAVPGEPPWHEHFERGVALVELSKGAEARAEFEQALRKRPQEGLRLATTGHRYLDYLPHLYLTAACHMVGELRAASEHLSLAERSGLAAQSPVGARLLAAYQALLREDPSESAAAPPWIELPERPRYKVYERKPSVLSEDEYRRIQREVLSRCRIPGAADREKTPWYYHYELGLELARRHDFQRALGAFIEAADRRSRPQRLARLYGMWFLDYLPYLQIARAHARLGNRECALDALAVSERLGEITDAERPELKALIEK